MVRYVLGFALMVSIGLMAPQQKTTISVTLTGLSDADCATVATVLGWTATVPDPDSKTPGAVKANPESACNAVARHYEELTVEILASAARTNAAKSAGDTADQGIRGRIDSTKKKPADATTRSGRPR